MHTHQDTHVVQDKSVVPVGTLDEPAVGVLADPSARTDAPLRAMGIAPTSTTPNILNSDHVRALVEQAFPPKAAEAPLYQDLAMIIASIEVHGVTGTAKKLRRMVLKVDPLVLDLDLPKIAWDERAPLVVSEYVSDLPLVNIAAKHELMIHQVLAWAAKSRAISAGKGMGKYVPTRLPEETIALIKELDDGTHTITDIARAIGLPKWRVRRYLRRLGSSTGMRPVLQKPNAPRLGVPSTTPNSTRRTMGLPEKPSSVARQLSLFPTTSDEQEHAAPQV